MLATKRESVCVCVFVRERERETTMNGEQQERNKGGEKKSGSERKRERRGIRTIGVKGRYLRVRSEPSHGVPVLAGKNTS